MVGSTEVPTTTHKGSPDHAPRKVSKSGIGRPRLEDSQSKTDRRRKQIREAQRNYRLRKEASVRDLQQRIVTLESTLTFLRSSYVGLYQSLCKIASTTGSQELSTLLEREKANVLAQSDQAIHIQPSLSPLPDQLSRDTSLSAIHNTRRSSDSNNPCISPPSSSSAQVASYPHFDSYSTELDDATDHTPSQPTITSQRKEKIQSTTTASSTSTSSSSLAAGFRKSHSYHDDRSSSSSFQPLGLTLPPPPQPAPSKSSRHNNNKDMPVEDPYLFKMNAKFIAPTAPAREGATTTTRAPSVSSSSGRESLAEKLVIQFLQTTLRALEENSLSVLGRMFPQGYCRKLLLPQIRHLLTIPPRQVIRMWKDMDRSSNSGSGKSSGIRRYSSGEKDMIKRDEPRLSFSSTGSASSTGTTTTTLSSGMIDRRLDHSPDLFRTDSNVSNPGEDSKLNAEHVDNKDTTTGSDGELIMNAQAIEEYIDSHGWQINSEIFLQSLLEKDVVVRGTPVYKKSLVDYAIFLAAQL